MKKRLLLALLSFVLLPAATAVAQIGNTTMLVFPGVPTGACSTLQLGLNMSNGNLYTCSAGSWTLSGSGAGFFPAPKTLTVTNGVTSLNAFGDSITAGSALSNGQTSQLYVNIVAAAWNLPIGTNFAVGGTRINQTGQLPSAYQQSPSATTGSVMLLGTNEMVDASTAGNRTQIGNGQQAMFTWLALPSAQKILASAMTQAGTWSTTTDFNLTSVFSQANNSTLTTATTLAGTTCYVAGAWGSGLNWNFDVLIDGVSQSGGTGYQLTWGLTASGHYPWALRFPGLAAGNHTIQVKALSATTAVADIQWVGCNGSSPQTPLVIDGGAMHHNTASDATVIAMNTVTQGIINNLSSDGLNIFYVDDYSVMPDPSSSINPPTYNADALHPNNIGNEVMAAKWLDTFGTQTINATQLVALEKAYLAGPTYVPNSVTSGSNCASGATGNSSCIVTNYLAGSSAGANPNFTANAIAKGTCTFASSTTCAVTFTTAMVSAPSFVGLTPINPGAVTFSINSLPTTTGFTITASSSNSLSVQWWATQ